MVIGHKYGLKILVPLVITWKPSLKLWLITLVIRRMLAMDLCLKGWNQKLWENVERKTLVLTAKTGKSSGNGRPNGQVVENGERNVGTCARTYVGNCGNRLKTGYTVDGRVKRWLSVNR